MVPRFERFGEHVDDHQVPFAARLDTLGLVRSVAEISELGSAIEAARSDPLLRAGCPGAGGIVRFLGEQWCARAGRQVG